MCRQPPTKVIQYTKTLCPCKIAGAKGEIMSDYIIVTDNAADLYFGYYEEHPTTRLPMPFTINGKSYEFEEECPDYPEYYQLLKEGHLVNTAQVNRATAYDMFKKVLDESGKDLLFISFSSGMSGSYDSMSAVLNGLKEEYPDRRLEIVDTLSGAGSEGLLVYYAKKMQDAGASMDEVIEWLEENKLNSHNIFIVDDIKNLKHSGRISTIAALLGMIMQVKPVFELDNNGKVGLLGKALGRKKAIAEMVQHFKEYYDPDANDFILIEHTCNQPDADLLAEKLKEFAGGVPIKFGYINRLVSGNAGYNAFVVFFMGKPRRKRITEEVEEVISNIKSKKN